MTAALVSVVWTINAIVLAYFVALNGVYLVTSLLAFGELTRYSRRLKTIDVEEILAGGAAPPITLLAPAYNEEATCVESVRSLLALRYPAFEVLVVNDGSKDRTLEVLTKAFELEPAPRAPTAPVPHASARGVYRSRTHPALWLVDKVNGGGKADALNAGIAYCRTPLFCALDADSLLEPDALNRVVRPFLEDARTVAVGGIIRIANGCTVRAGTVTDVRMPRNFLASMQVLEYLRAFLAGRMGWSALDATFIISGAFGLFRRETVVAVGGFRTDTVGEDMELVLRLHRHCRATGRPYRIQFIPDPVAWTECPESVTVLGSQRERWQRGLTETLIRHRTMLFNPRYGSLGVLAFPYYFFLEMLGPAIEMAGYVAFGITLAFGWVTPTYALAFFLVAFALGAVLSTMAVGLEELTFRRYPRTRDLLRLMWLSLVEPFGYRQLNTLWRIQGMWRALRGRQGWGEMVKKGFSVEAPR